MLTESSGVGGVMSHGSSTLSPSVAQTNLMGTKNRKNDIFLITVTSQTYILHIYLNFLFIPLILIP